MTRRKAVLLAGIATCAVVLVGMMTGSRFRSDLHEAEARLVGRSEVISTTVGPLEFAERGVGPALVMIHGTGGGFDQGLLFSGDLAEQGFRVIAPSRFGYLRSAPNPRSPEVQADALAALLDHLRIGDVVVAGGSAGANFAAAFALRHPDRCRALVLLVPAANLGEGDPVEMPDWQKAMVQRLAASDFLYWLLLRLAPDTLTQALLATDAALVDKASPEQQRRVEAIAEGMLPISKRTAGMIADGQLAGRPTELDYAAIRVPTLIISVEDDRFGTADTARQLAELIRDARLSIFPSGGHVWVGREAEVSALIADFANSTSGSTANGTAVVQASTGRKR